MCGISRIKYGRTSLFNNGGFTLIELLLVVLIISILAAIALPQYQKAVLKSRYSAMMPLAKSIANGNEVYYMEHGNYSGDPTTLIVQGKEEYPDGTNILMYNDGGLSYVRATNDGVPSARYLVYQKHSENFANTTMCEAADERANALCQALGGQIVEGGNSSGESGWTAYLLTGNYGSTDQFAGDPEDDSGNDPQTPACNEDEKPDDIVVNDTKGATAKCINGKWKYQWTGGQEYNYGIVSTRPYQVAGDTFQEGYCTAYWATKSYSCAYATFMSGTFCGAYSDTNTCDNTIYDVGACCDGRYCPVGSPVCARRSDGSLIRNEDGSRQTDGWHGDCCNPDGILGECPLDIDICQ